jgi:hypothetical protein
MIPRLNLAIRLVLIVGAIDLLSVCSQSDEFRLESASLPAPLIEAGKVNTLIEASAVEPIGDGRRFLVAHDKNPALYIVELNGGRILGPPITSPRFPQANGGGPKWEGMARDGEGNFYLIGAHNGKTDEERATKNVLIRFRLKDGDPAAIDDASIVSWHIARSLEMSLKAAGLPADEVAKRKIEGLTIREIKPPGGKRHRELVIGLREPSDKVRAFTADITSPPSPDAELELKPLFAFEAEPREGVTSQLTSLEYVAELDGFLVVTASEDTANAFHGNILWFVPNRETSHAQKIAIFEVAMKCEGLAILDVDMDARRTSVKLLITFDNDPHATHIPSRFQTATLVRESR